VGADIGERYKQQAQLCTPEFLFQGLKISNDCDIDYRLSKNKRLLVELALIRLCQLTDEKKKPILIDDTHTPIQKIIGSGSPETVTATITTEGPAAKVNLETQQPVVKKTSYSDSKSTFGRPGSISISATHVVASPQESLTEKKVVDKVIQNNSFTYEELDKAWQLFAETIPEQ
jgi:DNA polymerase III subunit gamma/tau